MSLKGFTTFGTIRNLAAVVTVICGLSLTFVSTATAVANPSDSGVATPIDSSGIQPLATYDNSWEYKDTNYGGAVLHFSGGYPCSVGLVVGQLSGGWDNVISSYRIANGCQENHYDGPSQTGVNTGFQAGSIPNIGSAMNDKTSSLAYH